MNTLKVFAGGLLAILLSALLLFLMNIDVISTLNQYSVGGYSDGYKNYYTFGYQLQHNPGYLHFEGMNYPFGEHIIFTDGQPLLVFMLKFFSNHIYDISAYTVGIVNSLAFFSVSLCALFLFLIFKNLKLPIWYAIIAAVLIALLSPQIRRMGVGHYALAYTFVIPMLFYCCQLFDKRPSWKLTFTIVLSIIACSFLHLYYLLICVMIVACFTLFSFLFDRDLGKLFQLLIQLLLPFICVFLFLKLSDPITDRPSTPFGFLVYKAQWESLFLPIEHELGKFIFDHKLTKFISKYIVPIRGVQFEGIAYVGLVSTFVLLFSAFWFPISKIRKRGRFKMPPYLKKMMGTGLLIGLFACGVPFVFGLEWTLDYLGPLKQFRSIGRFAWVFFYALNIFAFYFVYKFLNPDIHQSLGEIQRGIKQTNSGAILTKDKLPKKWSKGAIVIVLLIVFGVQFYDVNQLHRSKFYWLRQELPPRLTEQLTEDHWSKQLDIDKYQAILPMPFFHIGSEHFGLEQSGFQLSNTLTASWITALPIIGNYMSRTSLEQTLKSVEWTTEPYRLHFLDELKNHIGDDISKKNFLVLWQKEGKMSDAEKKIVSFAKPVWEDKDMQLFELNPMDLRNGLTTKIDSFNNAFYNQKLYGTGNKIGYDFKEIDGVLPENEIVSSDSLTHFVSSFFDATNIQKDRTEKGVLLNKENEWTIYNGAIKFNKSDSDTSALNELVFSMWIDLYENSLALCHIAVETDKGEKKDFPIKRSIIAMDKNWVLLEHKLAFKEMPNTLNIKVHYAAEKNVKQAHIDDLLIRPSGTDLYIKTKDGVWKNNRYWVK